MSSLYPIYTKKKVFSVKFKSWKKLISDVYGDNKYNFEFNSELIDVENRFRIVKVEDKVLIIKKTTVEKAEIEYKNAIMLKKIFEKENINNYKVIPVIPIVYKENHNAYIITEYKGYSLQEYLYDKKKSKALSLNCLEDIFNIFLRNGLLYRGFIPRNLIVRYKTIYLIDFEDLTIISNNTHIDLQFVTSIILNWQYFYKIEEIENIIKKTYIQNDDNKKLNSYEKLFSEILNLKENNYDIRLKIYNTAVKSEEPILNEGEKEYIIMPNDLVHLYSDLFGDLIDLLIDLLFLKLREKDDNKFTIFIKLCSYYIKNNYNDFNILKQNLFLLIFVAMNIVINKENNLSEYYNELISSKGYKNIYELEKINSHFFNFDNKILLELCLKEITCNKISDEYISKVINIFSDIGGKFEN